jgi:hypothetical protein
LFGQVLGVCHVTVHRDLKADVANATGSDDDQGDDKGETVANATEAESAEIIAAKKQRHEQLHRESVY